ncbi:FRG domain-containing protein [Azospirillum sp. sgz302134]
MSENYNYIAFGNRDYVEGAVDVVAMSRGRMFEYTPTDIGKRLEGLDPVSVAFLEKLPTFLCSEIEDTGDAVTMIVKFGRIEHTKADRKEVTAKFRTLIDFGVVEFVDDKQARDLFDASRYQLYRTHWAVREGDAQAILDKLARMKPETTGAVTRPLEADLSAAAAAPPPKTKKLIGTADSVEAFLAMLYELPSKKSTETFFRGQENEKFELTPSLLRKRPDGSWFYMPNEDRLCKEVLIAHYDEFQGDQYCFDRLVRMQHYGLPTRLLDITSNPLVALFFACCDAKGPLGADAGIIDGEVIIFQVLSEKIKYYDSDTVSCLANLSNLTYEQKNKVDPRADQDKFNASEVGQKLLHHIKSEKGFFEGRIIPEHLGSILCVKAKRTNTRIRSQSGAFLLFGHETESPDSGIEGIEISRIKITNKAHILKQLSSININETTVYPSIDRTTRDLKERYLTASAS